MRKWKQEKPSEPSGRQKERRKNMKKLINTDKILILALVATFLSFLKFVISVSIGNNFTPIFDVSIIDICILIILYIYEELIELQKGNKKSVEETEVKEHEENN